MAAPLYTTDSGLYYHAGKILVLAVGLPARGKTHISRALERYLRWMGIKTRVISLGDYRRRALGSAQSLPSDYFTLGEKCAETETLRKKISGDCEQTVWDAFAEGCQVVIYDANNGTKNRRQILFDKFSEKGVHVLYLESLCDNKEIIDANIRSVKISSPDYKGWDPEKAVADYWARIQDHEKHYQTIDDSDGPYIKILNVGEEIKVNDLRGYLQSRIVFFLMNIHNRYRTIYFARSGQSLVEHSYKVDADLSREGWDFADKLKDFIIEKRAKNLQDRGISGKDRRLVIWTSSRRRSHHTAWPFVKPNAPVIQVTASGQPISTPPIPQKSTLSESISASDIEKDRPADSDEGAAPGTLDNSRGVDLSDYRLPPSMVKVVEKQQMSEINPGIWDGLGIEDIKERYPDEWEQFTADPFSFRVPRAESYHDLCVRLEPIIIELERQQEDLLIIGHASVIRCLMAYLIGMPASELPAIEVARGDLIEVVPTSYGVISHAYHFWDGSEGRDVMNFYENFAEDTVGKKRETVGGGVHMPIPYDV